MDYPMLKNVGRSTQSRLEFSFIFAESNLRNVSALGFCTLFRAALLLRGQNTAAKPPERVSHENIWMTYSTSVLERNLLKGNDKKGEEKKERERERLADHRVDGSRARRALRRILDGRACLPLSSPIKPECDLPLILFNELPINEGNSRQR